MKKNNMFLIKFTLILIFIFIFINLGFTKETYGASAISVGDTVKVNELWSLTDSIKGRQLNVYCIDTDHHLKNGENYKITEIWTIEGNTVKKNGSEIKKNINLNQWQLAQRKAYILSATGYDDNYSSAMNNSLSGWTNEGAKRALKQRNIFGNVHKE